MLKITTIMLLTTIDGLLTLMILNRGAVELNPIMAYLINIDPLFFIYGKWLIVGCSTIILYRYAIKLLNYVIGLYSIVVMWQLIIIIH